MPKRIVLHNTTGYPGENGQPVLLQRGEEVEIPRDAEEKLDAEGALVPQGETLAEHLDLRLDIYRGARGDKIAAAKVAEAAAQGRAAEGIVDLSESGGSDLARTIKANKLSVGDTVALADGDPAKAQQVLDAENEATGGDPRKSVVDGLAKIISAE